MGRSGKGKQDIYSSQPNALCGILSISFGAYYISRNSFYPDTIIMGLKFSFGMVCIYMYTFWYIPGGYVCLEV